MISIHAALPVFPKGVSPLLLKETLPTDSNDPGTATPMPTFPSLVILIFSAAASDAPVANTNSVAFTDEENVASASA